MREPSVTTMACTSSIGQLYTWCHAVCVCVCDAVCVYVCVCVVQALVFGWDYVGAGGHNGMHIISGAQQDLEGCA